MWELLQKLEDLWWKPYWKSIAELTETEKNVRLLTSRSSWLWQFVCENGMVRLTEYYWVCNWIFWENIYYDESATEKFYTHRNYEYRLIEASLKNEDEIEQFLLDNIKVE